ncbi:penicillin-binding protein [bacterium]|nr:penicillin-binding protein [bacterium]
MRLKRILKIVIISVITILLLFSIFLGAVYWGIFGSLPDKESLVGITHEEASLVFSNEGTLIGKYFAENRTNIDWNEVPEHLINALIATEDKRFYEHEGIDSRSYMRVFLKSILLGVRSAGGGSTITQQLIKNLYGRDDHSFLSLPVNKAREAFIARRMEEVLTKQEILLLYLNSVPFGEEVFGVEAASKRYFNKNAMDLNIQESAVLVGILKANTYYNPRLHPDNATRRRNQVIDLMAGQQFIDNAEADSLKKLALGLVYTNYQIESPAGYFVYQVKKRASGILENLRNGEGELYDIQKDGLKIYTTLDVQLQQLSIKAAQNQLLRMQPLLDKELIRTGQRRKWEAGMNNVMSNDSSWRLKQKREILTPDGLQTEMISKADSLWHYVKMLNAAVLATNPNTGEILAWIGGNHFRYLPYDLVWAERQIASVIKPFIYAAALEDGFESCDYLNNSIITYNEYDGWQPENYDHSSDDDMKVAMWYALSRSLNLPTVDLYFETGHDQVADFCRRLGLDAPFEKTPALALGALDASLYDLVKAYSAFANGGLLPEKLVMIEKITDANGNVIYKNEDLQKTRVMTPTIAEQITAMLEKAVDEGTGISLRNRYHIQSELAGKTGTAQNYSDARFMIFTPDLVIGTWVGANSPEIHFQSGLGSGSSLALPIAGEMIAAIEKKSSARNTYLTSFNLPDEINEQMNCEPMREKGIGGFFNRLGKSDTGDAIEGKPDADTTMEQKERSKFGKFLDKLFKRKKR